MKIIKELHKIKLFISQIVLFLCWVIDLWSLRHQNTQLLFQIKKIFLYFATTKYFYS